MAETNTSQQDVLNDIESHTPERLHPILEAAFTYRKQLLIAVGAVVAIAAVYATMTAYTSKAKVSAQAELGAIMQETSGSERVSKLEGLLDSAPGAVKPAVLLALAETTMASGDYDNAAKYWDGIASKADDDTRLAAGMSRAKALLLAGKSADALADLKRLAADAGEGYIVPLNRQIAVAAEAAGDKAAALAAYRKLAEQNVKDKPFVDYRISQLEAE